MACIPVVDPLCNPATDLVGFGFDAMLDSMKTSTGEAAAWAIKTMVTGWLLTPSPIMDNQDVVGNLRKYTYWATTAIAVFSLLVAATRMALERSGKPATDAATGLVKLILVTSLTVPVTIILTEVGDSYARWIINRAANEQLGDRVLAFVPDDTRLKGVAVIAAIGISAMCLLVAVVQMLISIGIGGLKIVLCGVVAVPAAANIAGGGKTTLARYLSWLGAVLLYKPAAATIYAAGFWMVGEGTSFETILTGLVVIATAIVAMPALLRLLAPISAQAVGGGGAATMAGAGAAGAGTVATGAVRLAAASRDSAGGSGSPAGPAGSSRTSAQRSPAAIGSSSPGGGGGAAGGGRPPAPSTAPTPAGAGASPATAGAGATGASTGASMAGAAASGGGAAGGGAAAGGVGAAAGGTAASGAAAAGPVGAATAIGVAAAKAGPAAVKAVGGTASGAATPGEQQ